MVRRARRDAGPDRVGARICGRGRGRGRCRAGPAVGGRDPARIGGRAHPSGRDRHRSGAREAGRLGRRGSSRWPSWVSAMPIWCWRCRRPGSMSARWTIWMRWRRRFARAHGHRLRIATKYHRLVRDFLREHGVADYRLVDSQGATERPGGRRSPGGGGPDCVELTAERLDPLLLRIARPRSGSKRRSQ